MKKNKIILTATGLLTVAGLVSCGGNNRDIKPQHNIVFANCYSKDATEARVGTPKSCRVFPDWAYPLSGGDPELIDGKFGYIGTNDKGNVGGWTIQGETGFELGNDVDFTITFDDFVVLNPVDGELVKNPITGEDEVINPVYFKIYVSNDDEFYYSYNELGRDCYTIDDSTPGVYKFHIPGEYVRYSYKVFFSASYLDVTRYGFGGFDTRSFKTYENNREQSEFEKSVDNVDCYRITNSRVGGRNLSCVISPRCSSAGLSFTPDYIDKLQFFGLNNGSTGTPEYKDITNYVHTNLVRSYANTANAYKYRDYEKEESITEFDNRILPTNQFNCNVTLPWINSVNPEGALFTYKDGNYTLNYQEIVVNVKEDCIEDKIPTYIKGEEICKKIIVNADKESIEGTPEISFKYIDSGDDIKVSLPIIEIKLKAKENHAFTEDKMFDLVKINPDEAPDFSDYFNKIDINSQYGIEEFNGHKTYTTSSSIQYNFNEVFRWEASSDYSNITINIDLTNLMKNICFGPESYSTYPLEEGVEYLSINDLPDYHDEGSKINYAKRTVTIDMIDSIELGFHADAI